MRNHLDQELEQLHKELIEMGAVNERALGHINTLFTQERKEDMEAVKDRIRECEIRVDDLERSIQSRAMRLLVSQQPVAKDLRSISTALNVITDMERIGDQAYDIAETAMFLAAGEHRLKAPERIGEMVECCARMVNRSVDAYVAQSVDISREVIAADDEVDSLFRQVRDELIQLINRSKESGEQAIDYIMIAKYLERIADHAVNVAEWVVFHITGEHKKRQLMY